MARVKKETTIKIEKTVKKVADKKVTATRTSRFSVPVFSLTGRELGTMELPKEIFGKEVNKNLLAQALRVYMTNQKVFTASTKTRGEVRGSTAKIFRQKGTGRARHGAIRAPIFVGGGIVFGPKPRKAILNLPKKMRQAALTNALSAKMSDKKVVGLTGIDKVTGKTKEIATLVKKLSVDIQSALIVTGEKNDNIIRAAKNISGVDVLPSNSLNAYEVLRHEVLAITKEGLDELSKKSKGESK